MSLLLRRSAAVPPVSARAGSADDFATTRQNVVAYIGTVDLGYDGLMDNFTKWANGKYGDIVNPPAGTPIDWSKVPADRKAQFQKDYQAYTEWRGAFSSWKTFSQGYTTADWWDRWTTGTAAAKSQVDSYRELLIAWRTKAVALGVPVTTILPDRPAVKDIGIPWATLAMVVVGGVVLYALVSRSSGGATPSTVVVDRPIDRDKLLGGHEHYAPA